MLDELKRLGDYLRKDDQGRLIWRRIAFFSALAIIAVIFNRFVFADAIADRMEVRIDQAKILILSENSPYDAEIHKYLEAQAIEKKIEVDESDLDYEAPIINLVLVYALSFLPPVWASAVFLTINQICLILCLLMLLALFNYPWEMKRKLLAVAICIVPIFVVRNLLDISPAMIQLVLLTGAVYFDSKAKPIASGIFLGVGAFVSLNYLVAIISAVFIFIKNKKRVNLIWTAISMALLSVFSFIFDGGWILNWLKTLFLSPSRFPFLTYADVLSRNYGTEVTRVIIIVPIFLVSWLILEWWRTKPHSEAAILWLMGLGGIINNYIMLSLYDHADLTLLFALVVLIGTWVGRIGETAFYVFAGSLLASLAIPTALYFLTDVFSSPISNAILLFVYTVIFLLNLYWSRGWVTQQRPLYNPDN